MATAHFETAEAVTAAIAKLSDEQRRAGNIIASQAEGGGYDVTGSDDAIAALTALPSADRLRAYAAEKRWRVETGGITVGGASIETDRASQAMITGAHAYALANPEATIAFKAAAGFISLSADQVIAIATVVGAHVQACFAAEATISAAITAGTITDFAAIDAADWPA